MPTPTKAAANSTKHRTRAEQRARAQAEASTSPERETVRLRKPALIRSDRAAEKYWTDILRELRSSGAELVDNLDSEVFAGYCSMLAMRDRLATLTPKLMDAAAQLERVTPDALADDPDTAGAVLEQVAGLLKSCAQLSEKRNKLDSTILSYAEKLGLTPSGRARLAVKRAEQEDLGAMGDLLDF